MQEFEENMIKRQLSLINESLGKTLSAKEIAEKIAKSLKSGILPLVERISFLNYPEEFSREIMNLSRFPFEKKENQKWLHKFAYKVTHGRMFYFHTFTEKDARSMKLTSEKLIEVLNQIKKALPFLNITISKLDNGEINFYAIDNIIEQHNLIKTIGKD